MIDFVISLAAVAATSFALGANLGSGRGIALLIAFGLSITNALLVFRRTGRTIVRSDIGAMLDKIAAGAEDDATQHARGLVIHGGVQTLILANSVTVDSLQVTKAPGQTTETAPS